MLFSWSHGLGLSTESQLPSTKVPRLAKGIHISWFHCAEYCVAEGMSSFVHCYLKSHDCSGFIFFSLVLNMKIFLISNAPTSIAQKSFQVATKMAGLLTLPQTMWAQRLPWQWQSPWAQIEEENWAHGIKCSALGVPAVLSFCDRSFWWLLVKSSCCLFLFFVYLLFVLHFAFSPLWIKTQARSKAVSLSILGCYIRAVAGRTLCWLTNHRGESFRLMSLKGQRGL